MKFAANGKAKVALVSTSCTVLACAIAISGWYTGRQTKIEQAAARQQRLDDLILDYPRGLARLSLVEMQAAKTANKVDNLDENVRMLIEAQERLTQTLMRYLEEQAKRPRP